jgi:flagellar biosynthesis/type III secretory pathway protein FliH
MAEVSTFRPQYVTSEREFARFVRENMPGLFDEIYKKALAEAKEEAERDLKKKLEEAKQEGFSQGLKYGWQDVGAELKAQISELKAIKNGDRSGS